MKRQVQILFFMVVCVCLSVGSVWAMEEPSLEIAPINPAFSENGHVSPVERFYRDSDPSITTQVQLPATYDLRDMNKLTAVQAQAPYGTCWAFAALASLESCALPEIMADFSENNLAYNNGFDYVLTGGLDGGGNDNMVAAYLLRWDGPVFEADDPYKSAQTTGLSPAYHVQSVEYIESADASIKQAIMDNGAVASQIHIEDCYDHDTGNHYNATYTKPDHDVAIVGWDDNYSCDNFLETPPGDGAWLMRNSWGTDWGDGGYFYSSYYSECESRDVNVFNSLESVDNYDSIYQYDLLGNLSLSGYSNETAWGANVFTATSDEQLKAVGTYACSQDTTLDIYVYTDLTSNQPRYGTEAIHQQVTFDNGGYYTVVLDEAIDLVAGEKFSVVIKYNTPYTTTPLPIEAKIEGYSMGAVANNNESFADDDGDCSWMDVGETYDSNVCIKAYTDTDVSKKCQSIVITHPADILEYIVGDAYNMSGLEVSRVFDDDSVEQATLSIANITGFDSSSPAVDQVVTITVDGFTTTYKVQIREDIASYGACVYQTHVQDIGWQEYVADGTTSGTSGASKRLEGIRIYNLVDGADMGIEYSTHIENIGWQEISAEVGHDGYLGGTSGQSLRLEAIQINLTGPDADNYDVYYQVHAQNFGWLGWAKNGESSGTAGFGYRLEAIRVQIIEHGNPVPVSTIEAFVENGPQISDVYCTYQTHVQDVGWQDCVKDGAASGTSGKALRLEGIKIETSDPTNLDIMYRTHVQDIGWQNWKYDGEMSGTSGESRRLEAIDIQLTGVNADNYDIYYQVHAQNFGWLDWAKNGESSGTAGFGYRLEAIRIVVVPKGDPAPGSTGQAFVEK
jgi:C1A family cysteine protease/uncharacterized protein YjdB